ncbi:MAG: acyl-CoA dehydratase activase-related protein [Prevotella sp.]|nr:acyl-CoA dehydratase activase-related protein [Prevotella sp.]
MEKRIYRIGLDVGSTTAKIAVTDQENNLVYSRYERHNAKVGQLVGRYLDEIARQLGDCQAQICVTGSVGMATAEQLRAEFVQEVVAATVYAKELHPEAKALIDIGGEDAKVVFFGKRGMELRMNGNCAGGTGAFLDQMAALMGIDNSQLNQLALQSTQLYPMAARCGVFAKTDVQNLMARNIPKADIAASIFHSIAVQTVTTLSHGCDYEPPLLLCGGPLTFMPALRRAFADYLKMDAHREFIVSDQSNLIPAIGCAIRAARQDAALPLHTLRQRLDTERKISWHSDLQPLFASDGEHEEWCARKLQYATPKALMRPNATERIYIGIDSGSTTTKIIAARQDGTVVFSHYAPNLGNPIKAVQDGLDRLQAKATANNTVLEIAGSCSTGYGEDLIKAAFNLDGGIIETMAHYQAAARLMPDVSFILDIGGQDMKAIFVEDGAVVRMDLNEACSSGCGTFLQTFASNLSYSISDFAHIACTAPAPCDLGTRCTVFMNSKVKQVMREGATVADISAGLSYSVVKNCLYKVLKLRGNDDLGQHIVVQGGTMRNDAVVRAFELLTGHEVARSDMPELMGAYGCALHAIREKSQANDTATGHSTSLPLRGGVGGEAVHLHCHGCENHCDVTRYTFPGGNRFYSGNKCERIFNNYGKGHEQGENVYTYKYERTFGINGTATGHSTPLPLRGEAGGGAVRGEAAAPSLSIGIPRVLGMYEEYPFWQALFAAAGIRTVLSSRSTFTGYESQLRAVMSDNICFPAKLVHAHIAELDGMGLDRIFFPYVVYEHKDDERTDNSFNCPIVSAYSDVVRSSMQLRTQMDSPVINFASEKLLRRQLHAYLKPMGISRKDIDRAITAALDARRLFETDLRQRNEEILARSRQQGKLTILLAGRPYHTDPLIQHKLSETIAALGVNVISDDIVRGDSRTGKGDTYLVEQWAYTNRIIKAAEWAACQGNDVHFVEMTSFGCGPDAFVQDEVRDIMRRHGKPFTLLKIDDVSNTGSLKLRVRSLVESLRIRSQAGRLRDFPQTKVFRNEDRHRKILAPFFTEYLSPLMPPLMKLAGYDLEILPMSDTQSAQYGLTYANNEVCYPATLIVGDMVKALRSGKYNPDDIALVMTQTGGQCRATNYTALIKRAMIANGFGNVPLITLGVSTAGGDNEQEGFEYPWLKLASITTNAFLYSDALAKLFYAAVVRETVKGRSEELKKKYLRLAEDEILRNNAKGLVSLIAQAAEEFEAITDDRDCPKVGIVGEIFLKFNPFSHQFLARKLIARGIEVVPPLISPFFLQEFINIEEQKNLCLSDSRVPNFIVRTLYKLIERRQEQFNKAGSRFRHFRPFTSIYEDAKGARGIVSFAAQFGEGWLLPADIAAFHRDGVRNVISLQPFGCIANHIISKGIEKKLHDLYPDLNLLSLDFDSGVSEVNVTNRLLLFLEGSGSQPA